MYRPTPLSDWYTLYTTIYLFITCFFLWLVYRGATWENSITAVFGNVQTDSGQCRTLHLCYEKCVLESFKYASKIWLERFNCGQGSVGKGKGEGFANFERQRFRKWTNEGKKFKNAYAYNKHFNLLFWWITTNI